MITRTVTIGASLGIRSASLFVQTANRFASDINIQIDEKIANAKSLMGIMSLGIMEGQQIQLLAEGHDAKQALSMLERFFQGPFHD